MTAERDFYDVLGVERGAGDDDIKRAFRKLAQQWHPDVNTDAAAQERFKEINEAYQVLSDPQRRQTYDMFGKAGLGADGGPGFAPLPEHVSQRPKTGNSISLSVPRTASSKEIRRS